MAAILYSKVITEATKINAGREAATTPEQSAEYDRQEYTLCVEVLEAMASGFLDKAECRDFARAALGRA